jgi:hypothetical protein
MHNDRRQAVVTQRSTNRRTSYRPPAGSRRARMWQVRTPLEVVRFEIEASGPLHTVTATIRSLSTAPTISRREWPTSNILVHRALRAALRRLPTRSPRRPTGHRSRACSREGCRRATRALEGRHHPGPLLACDPDMREDAVAKVEAALRPAQNKLTGLTR